MNTFKPKQTILIVDDKPENLIALEAILIDTGAELVKANSGRQALSILLKENVSLVLLDVQMPEMDGFEVAKLMKGQKRTAMIPIIFVTAIITDEQNILEGYSSGAVDYIVKPINPKILLNKVQVFLELDAGKKSLEHAFVEMNNQRTFFESILTAAADGVIGLDERGHVTFANPAALSILGYTLDQLVTAHVQKIWSERNGKNTDYEETPFFRALSQQKPITLDEALFYRKNGDPIPVNVVCSPLAGDKPGTVVVFQDITIKKALEAKLLQQAKTDALTGLANRIMFVQTLRQAIARAKRLDLHLAVLFLDLDQFKQINDTMGHDAGDVLLLHVSQRLMHVVRENDSIARLGGDEFIILLEDIKHDEDAARVAEKIRQALKEPFVLNNREIIIGASIGIASFPRSGTSASDLMQAADVAMYRVKAFGRNNYQFFTPEMNEEAQYRLMIEQELRHALSNNSFELYYQPQTRIGDDSVVGVEALLRWHRTPEELVSPMVFIDILEETGLILPVGKWVLWMACLQAQSWISSGVLDKNARMCVNISVRQFTSPDFFDGLIAVLEETELNPRNLEIEITESSLMTNTKEIQTLLKKIKKHGVRISIDDFGTGYSNLGYLKQFTIDLLKIDRSFITEIDTSEKDRSLVTSIANMGHSLGFEVIAEGVETKEQLAVLKTTEVDFYQGYYFSKPMPVDEFDIFMQKKSKAKTKT